MKYLPYIFPKKRGAPPQKKAPLFYYNIFMVNIPYSQ